MERTQWKNGPHLLEFEPPDLFHCHVVTTVELEHSKETIRVLTEEVVPKVGKVCFFMHLKDGLAGGASPEARKYIGTVPPLWKAMALIGGSAVTRAIFNVSLRAMNLLSSAQVPTKLFKTADEARAWYEDLRAAEQNPPTAK